MPENEQTKAAAEEATAQKNVAELKPFGASPGWQLWPMTRRA